MIDPVSMVGSKYGAPMGRPNFHNFSIESPLLYLRRVLVDRQGYDSGGAYWGLGPPLYWCGDNGPPGQSISYYFRLDTETRFQYVFDRDRAKAAVLEIYPQARFFR